MSAPELKQKKIARDQAIAKAEADAAAKAATAAAEHTKAILEKAKQYEAEYQKVGDISLFSSVMMKRSLLYIFTIDAIL